MIDATASRHQLRFCSLVAQESDFVFPCDAQGRVDLDALSDPVRNDYFFARAMIGRGVAAPRVECAGLH
jgi:hypothetical protein